MNNTEHLVITERFNAAIAYSQTQNWQIIPCHAWVDGNCTCDNIACGSKAKHPLTLNGCKDATTDPTTITVWWSQTQGYANVGIVTGPGSNLIVVDVDISSGGMTSLNLWEQDHGAMPITPTAKTGSGGRHYYFRYPTGSKIGNRAGIVPGIDVRGDGGYVLAPPSIHASGGTYQWIQPPETPLADLPEWLLHLISTPKKVEPVAPSTSPALVLSLRGPTPDLTDSPGVGEGQRHHTLCKLVGVHLARGEAVEKVEAAALTWGARCWPPMDEEEVLRTVQSISAKHQDQQPTRKVIVESDDLDATPLPPPQEWPELDPEALIGLPGDIIRTMEPHTEADPVGMLGTLMIAAGNCIGRQPYFPVEGDHHHVNLFGVLVGESSRGRKGTSMGRVMSLFPGIDDHWVMNCMAAGLSSGEGLIWAVRDPIEKTMPTKEKGLIKGYQTVVDDPGVTDKRLLVVESEFAQALRVLGREGNTLSAIIRQSWDKGSLRALTKNNSAQATDTHVSILGHITKPELTKYLGDTDCFNGFANRFLWILVKRSKFLPDGGENIDIQPLRARLKQAIAVARQVTSIGRSPEARILWRRVYQELAAEKNGLYGAVTGRAEAQTLRLSMLYALLDGSSTIEETHLRAALALWRFSDDSARLIFNQDNAQAEDPMEKQLLGLIRLTPGINRKGLHKALGGHVPAKALVEALAKLRDRRRIRAEVVATGGRPGECWFPCLQPDETLITVIGPDAVGRTNKVDVGMGFELPSFDRTEPNGPAMQECSLVCTNPPHQEEVEPLPPAVEVMSDAEWQTEINKLGSF